MFVLKIPPPLSISAVYTVNAQSKTLLSLVSVVAHFMKLEKIIQKKFKQHIKTFHLIPIFWPFIVKKYHLQWEDRSIVNDYMKFNLFKFIFCHQTAFCDESN